MASEWLARLSAPDAVLRGTLERIYGLHAIDDRVGLIRRVVSRFLDLFGDRSLRVFRAPGRINLRGMHVDSHGGWLNLMTHQREVVVAVTPECDDTVCLANIDPRFDEVRFRIGNEISRTSFRTPYSLSNHDKLWLEFIMHPDVRAEVETRRGWWGNYVKGSALSVRHCFPDAPLKGVSGVVGSDLPRGAALSSSAALCVALTRAMLDINTVCQTTTNCGLALDNDRLIVAARDAEWYTGSRCGLSDQAAIVLGDRDAFVNIALYPTVCRRLTNCARLETASARRVAFPESLRVLVINSLTERSLSGAAQVDYTRNRFAYSLAMEILRQEMRFQGTPAAVIEKMDRLSNMTPAVLIPMGGMRMLLEVIKRIPEIMEIDELRSRTVCRGHSLSNGDKLLTNCYDLPEFEEAYERYFGSAPERERPTRIALRGPLLFGIAESERARLFPEAIASGAFEEAGRLMSVGHDGDRRVRRDGAPDSLSNDDKLWRCAVDNATLDGLIASGARIEWFPGAYGASSPALDALVDAATEAGALGASLTGAGMAGAVLALCKTEDADRVAEYVRKRLASPGYLAISGRDAPPTREDLDESVVSNMAVAPAGELRIVP